MKYYTGIGSRETPPDLQSIMIDIAKALSNDNWCLRSGGAEGADSAFEAGADLKRIYLPWSGFNDKYADNRYYVVPQYNEEMVLDYHPDPYRLSKAGMKLMSRNSYQVLGDNLDNPSAMLICWTRDGKMSGGTAQAMRIAADFGVPIYNLYNETALTKLCSDFDLQLA